MKNIPILLLTGYLGSGKTTLVNKILTNRKGLKFAVIVNDLGEVNIDASLIETGGVVNRRDDSLMALQNGCICCTLKMDLVEQLNDIVKMQRFDYIVIEASGICEPEPIARTICSIPAMKPAVPAAGAIHLDCITTVVDVLRMRDEFACGNRLFQMELGEDDIENLVIQQIEFCNMVLLNKASEVTPDELGRVREIVRTLQPSARILTCDYGDIDLDLLLNTGLFDYNSVASSAAWISAVEGEVKDEDDDAHAHEHDEDDEHDHDHNHDDDEHDHRHGHDDDDDDDEAHEEHGHGHGHHHHHHHGEGEAEEYGIGTYVYYARDPMKISEFDQFVARHWPEGVIRAKGICYFSDEEDVCYLFEQAGRQISLRNVGQWFATMPEKELKEALRNDATLARDWDPFYGDRMQKLVFIGQHLDKAAIRQALDRCLIAKKK